jgi:hypothetical protein
VGSVMDALALAPSERAFLEALNRLGVRYPVVGMSAALLQGARGVTEDVALWLERIDDPRIGKAARIKRRTADAETRAFGSSPARSRSRKNLCAAQPQMMVR